MNRRERRAARFEPPPMYVQTCVAMDRFLRDWLLAHPGITPRFAVPDPIYIVGAGIDQFPHLLARDDHARSILDSFIKIGRELSPVGEPPTILMLRVVLVGVGVPADIAPIGDFGGTLVPLPRGPRGAAS